MRAKSKSHWTLGFKGRGIDVRFHRLWFTVTEKCVTPKPQGWVTLKKYSAGSTTMHINDAEFPSRIKVDVLFVRLRFLILASSDWI